MFEELKDTILWEMFAIAFGAYELGIKMSSFNQEKLKIDWSKGGNEQSLSSWALSWSHS